MYILSLLNLVLFVLYINEKIVIKAQELHSLEQNSSKINSRELDAIDLKDNLDDKLKDLDDKYLFNLKEKLNEKPETGLFGFSLPKLPFSLFSGIPCLGSSLLTGTCEKTNECLSNGGISDGKGLCIKEKICCAKTAKCGETTFLKHTLFTNPAYPKQTRETGQCVYTIKILPFVEALRISFLKMILHPPDYQTGNCEIDAFWVEGADESFKLGKLCGVLTRSHIYVPVFDKFAKEVKLHIALSKDNFDRKWLIKVEQLKIKLSDIPPEYCTQYYTGETGTIRSFNVNPNNNTGLGNINGLNYVICIRQEKDFCKIKFEPIFFDMGYENEKIHQSYTLTSKTGRNIQNSMLNKYYYQPVLPSFKQNVQKLVQNVQNSNDKLSNKLKLLASNVKGLVKTPTSMPIPIYRPITFAPTTAQPLTYSYLLSPSVTDYNDVKPSNPMKLDLLSELKNKLKLMVDNDKMDDNTNLMNSVNYSNQTYVDSEYTDNGSPYEPYFYEPYCKSQDIVNFPPPDNGGPAVLCGNRFYNKETFSSSYPFLVRVVNRGTKHGRGFILNYKQIAC